MILKNCQKIAALFVLLTLCCSLSFASDKKMPWEERQKAPPTCKKLTNLCSTCSDGVKRVPGSSKRAKFSDYKCASGGESVLLVPKYRNKNCKAISDYCAVCKGNTFIFTKTGNRIESDLYACATSPKTIRGFVKTRP